MSAWTPGRDAVRIRNATVAAVTAPTVTVTLDGQSIPGVAVYGPMPGAGAKVLVLEQGTSLLVLGNAVSLLAELRDEIEALKARIGGP